MNRTTIMIFSFVAGALLADVTHPAGQRFWVDPVTDSDFGCTDDCLEPEAKPAEIMLTCWAAKTHVRCEVLEIEEDWSAFLTKATLEAQ